MKVSLIIDLVALAIILGFAIYGICRGFFSLAFGVVSWIAAILLTWKLYPFVAGWFTQWGLHDVFNKFGLDKLHLDAFRGISYDSLASSAVKDLLAQAGIAATPEAVQAISGPELVAKLGGAAAILTATGIDISALDVSGLNGLGVLNNIHESSIASALSGVKLPEFIKKWLLTNNSAEKYNTMGVDNLGDYLSGSAANILVNICAILATFIVLAIILRLLCRFFEKMNDVPAVGTVNRVLGGIIGVLMGVMIIWVVLLLLSFLGVTTSFEKVATAIDESNLCRILNQINPFAAFLKSAIAG